MENKFKKQLEELIKVSDAISEKTELYNYIKQINDLINSDGEKELFPDKYKKIVERTLIDTSERPFLSVIVRTQGNRSLGLRESLLCLRAQTNQDFEVVLIGHKVEKEKKIMIREIISEQPKDFRDKIRYIEVDDGTRTTPLNVGFANAKGRYISIFDDDDILFDNWVEKFYEAEQENDGKILHAFAFAQEWKVYSVGENEKYIALKAPTNQYCYGFDYFTQLVVNRCPLMTLAFPSVVFQRLGMIFNESLNVTEDWEYLMRIAPLVGVKDIFEATSIYRLWSNAETSATLHNEDTWLSTYHDIQDKMNNRALLLPEGNVTHLISLMQRLNEYNLNMPSGYPKLQGLLYYGVNDEFSDERMIVANNGTCCPKINMKFKIPSHGYCYFRFDPCEFGGIILKNIEIIMITDSKNEIIVNPNEIKNNGIQCEEGIYFMHYDPQVIWSYVGERQIENIIIRAEINMEIQEELVITGIERYSKSGKIKRKIKNVIKTVVGR